MTRLVRVVRLARAPIFQQLCIEEALFYKTDGNWCLYNEGCPTEPPTVVLGISGKPERMCNLDAVRRDGIPLIRRFSGGGTVIVDQGTIFATLIMKQGDVPECQPYPRDIMSWTEKIYGPAFSRLVDRPDATRLSLRENDYVFGDLKFGGNAQAITRDRWLHHTSFLWSFDPRNMSYLRIPDRMPEYRNGRDHAGFLTTLDAHIGSRGGGNLGSESSGGSGSDGGGKSGSSGGGGITGRRSGGGSSGGGSSNGGASSSSSGGGSRDAIYGEVVAALRETFRVEETPLLEVAAVVDELGGMAAWMRACRTRFVGADGAGLVAAAAARLHGHADAWRRNGSADSGGGGDGSEISGRKCAAITV
ncbi:unnamed protein product [Phaeothamnion confervicola]